MLRRPKKTHRFKEAVIYVSQKAGIKHTFIYLIMSFPNIIIGKK